MNTVLPAFVTALLALFGVGLPATAELAPSPLAAAASSVRVAPPPPMVVDQVPAPIRRPASTPSPAATPQPVFVAGGADTPYHGAFAVWNPDSNCPAGCSVAFYAAGSRVPYLAAVHGVDADYYQVAIDPRTDSGGTRGYVRIGPGGLGVGSGELRR